MGDLVFRSRDELQEALFSCSHCKSTGKNSCLIRNEDLLGSSEAKIWIVGINPHCYPFEEKCFAEGKIIKTDWKRRAISYFTEEEIKDFCGKNQKKTYSYFTRISEKLHLKSDDWEKGRICSVDFYKMGTTNERELAKKISNNPLFMECPNKYFVNQLKMYQPKLIIVTGKTLRKEFRVRWGDEFDLSSDDDIWMKKISEIPIKGVEWKCQNYNRIISVVFCMSFSSHNYNRWTDSKYKTLGNIIRKYLDRIY